MYWAFTLFLDLLIECNDLLTERNPHDPGKWAEMMDMLTPFAKVPIITPRELVWTTGRGR
jgi:hypothetical protein